MQEWYADERTKRIIRALYRHSGIETRHSVVANIDREGEAGFFKVGPDGGREPP
jgi:hypothetical protein